MTKEEIKKHLQDIGFTGFVPLRKEKRDGKKRLTWSFPVESHKDLMVIILVEENEKLVIELFNNPFGQTFDRYNIIGLIKYIRKHIICR